MKNIKDLRIMSDEIGFFVQGQRSDEYLYYLLQEGLDDAIVGQSCQYQIGPFPNSNIPIPNSYNNNYQSEFYEANSDAINQRLGEIVKIAKYSLIALMPYGNLKTYEELIAIKKDLVNLISTASLSEIGLENPNEAINLQCYIENKAIFNQMLKSSGCDNRTEMIDIDFTKSYEYWCNRFNVKPGRPLFIMKTDEVTAGGSGLRCIRSQDDMDIITLLWQQFQGSCVIAKGIGNAKENSEYEPTYSANGRFVCIPDPKNPQNPIIYIGKLTKKPTGFTANAISPNKANKYQFPPFSALGDSLNIYWEDCYYESYTQTIKKYVSYLFEYIYQETGKYLPLQGGLDFVIDKDKKRLIATEVNLRKQGPDYFLQFLNDTKIPLDKLRLLYRLAQGKEVEKLLATFDPTQYNTMDIYDGESLGYLKLRPIAGKKRIDIVSDKEKINGLEGIYKRSDSGWMQITGSEGYSDISKYLFNKDVSYVYFTPPKISNTKEGVAYTQESYILGSGDWFDPDLPNLTDQGYSIMEDFYKIVTT